MGGIPLGVERHFIVNGTERVIVSDASFAGCVLRPRQGQGRTRPASSCLPPASSRIAGSWLGIEFDAKTSFLRASSRRKLPVTSLLFALGMDGEEVLSTFYKHIIYKRTKDGWRVPFDATRLRGYKAVNDLVDADTGRLLSKPARRSPCARRVSSPRRASRHCA